MAETDKAKHRRWYKKWFPTRKWWTLLVTTAATIAQMLWTGDGINTDVERITLIGLLAGLLLTYLVPNDRRAP